MEPTPGSTIALRSRWWRPCGMSGSSAPRHARTPGRGASARLPSSALTRRVSRLRSWPSASRSIPCSGPTWAAQHPRLTGFRAPSGLLAIPVTYHRTDPPSRRGAGRGQSRYKTAEVNGSRINAVRRRAARRYDAAVPELSAGVPRIPGLPWDSLRLIQPRLFGDKSPDCGVPT